MTKKRKATSRVSNNDHNAVLDSKTSKMRAITSYEDVADSEDEFHMDRDKVMLDDEPDAKRRKRSAEDADLEPSDDEILGYSESDSENSSILEDTKKPNRVSNSDSGLEEEEEEEEYFEGWGTSKQEYYNNDQIETEADALEEEAEARRLQQKKLKKMSAADFGFDETEWLTKATEETDKPVVTEVIKEQEITPDISEKERLRILQTRYPEFEPLANELLQLQLTLKDLQKQTETEVSTPCGVRPQTSIKCRALAAYVSTLSMYFAIIASPANGCASKAKALGPSELRDHSVMDYLLQCRELWSKVKDLDLPSPALPPALVPNISDENSLSDHSIKLKETAPKTSTKLKVKNKREAAAQAATSLIAKRIHTEEMELDELTRNLPKIAKSLKRRKPEPTKIRDDSDASDFGEEETMDAKLALEKAKKKKSLRFYTSQIVQKSNKRLGAGREAGGDEDIPHRERLRDRQARLNAEAEKRGRRKKDLVDEQSDSEKEDQKAQQVRQEGNEYYDIIARTAQKKKAEKAARLHSEIEDSSHIVEEKLREGQKRAIGYAIEKNKGLAPRRKKDVRNPRVKKRKKFEEKKRKLVSVRAVYKGGEERGGYGGEKTGIKTGLVKSIKL